MITRALHRATDTALGYTVAAGAWTFAVATYPAAVAVALVLASTARRFHDALDVWTVDAEEIAA